MPRAGLSRDRVVAIAVDLVDDGGVDGFRTLTLAAVAARAGVAVPSLYKHVGSLADLQRSVAVVAVRELTDALTAATSGVTGPAAVSALAHGVRDYARAAPGRYAATQVAADLGDPDDVALAQASAATVRAVSAALAASGIDGQALDGEHLVHTVRTVRAAVHGFVSLELGGGFGMPEDVDESFEHLVTVLIAGLSAR